MKNDAVRLGGTLLVLLAQFLVCGCGLGLSTSSAFGTFPPSAGGRDAAQRGSLALPVLGCGSARGDLATCRLSEPIAKAK